MLLEKIRERDYDLASDLEAAIDAGKDVLEEATIAVSKKPRKYRRTVRFSDEEALRVVIGALKAHFVEQPQLAVSAMREFADSSVEIEGPGQFGLSFDRPPSEMVEDSPLDLKLELEVQTATKIAPEGKKNVPETVSIPWYQQELIDEQKTNIDQLSELVEFDSRSP